MDLQELFTTLQNAIRNHASQVYRRDMMVADAIKASPFATDIADAEDNIKFLSELMTELESQIKGAVLECGQSVKYGDINAVYTKGREMWDTKTLEILAETNPELNTAKKVGKPSVSIRK